jgi:hypothetical protein
MIQHQKDQGPSYPFLKDAAVLVVGASAHANPKLTVSRCLEIT